MTTIEVAPSFYKRASDPFKVGQKRQRVWRALLAPATAQDDPLWQGRARDYWNRQAMIYGAIFSEPRVAIDNQNGLVMTEAYVLQVLPGERY